MCGRYSFTSPIEAVRQVFKLPALPATNLQPRYNIAPTQNAPVIRLNTDGERELVMMRWGLIPFWAKEEKIGYRTINARAETVASKPSFRAAFRQRRCLVPATGFYEWQVQGKGKLKQPYNIAMADGGPFGMAGLWERWEGPDGPVETYTIVVGEPNDLVRPIHNRMPIIIGPEDHDSWLSGTADDANALLKPYKPEAMTAWPVSTVVNSPKNDKPECIEPLAA